MIWDPVANPIYYADISTPDGKTKIRTPGITTIEGNSGSPRNWDEVKGYGFSGATLRFTGLGLAPFDMLISLYSSRDWQDWDTLVQQILQAPSQQKPRTFKIAHPKLEAFNVSACVLLDIAWPKETEEGVGQCVIYWKAYRGRKFQPSKIDADPATPADEFEKRLQSAFDRLEKVANS